MGKMKILHVVGARPNFMKVAPVMSAMAAYEHLHSKLVHTGQHYDHNMSEVFFNQLGIRKPEVNLGVGSCSHAEQTARIMMGFEPLVLNEKPDWVFVYGDVNSTVAASLVCAKLGIAIAHVEAGLRSGDRSMPEEVNRLVTDQLANMLLTPSEDGSENLIREGISEKKIHLVGNVMIDTLVRLLDQAKIPAHLTFRDYVLVTLHRPGNVDDPLFMGRVMQALGEISHRIPVIFPIHPRTYKKMREFGVEIPDLPNFKVLDPLGYLEFLGLQKNARAVISDSGGIQEETTFLGVPCLTLRPNTERPITITEGTNKLIGQDLGLLKEDIEMILQGKYKSGRIPYLWDGNAGERIAALFARMT